MKRIGIIIIGLFFLFACFGQQDSTTFNDTSVFIESSQKVKNIILMIGDGMGVSQIYAGMTVNKSPLNIEKIKNIGFAKTYSASDYITDSGASGTAIATGHKTYNKAIGVDKDTVPVKSILEYAEDHGKATGLVATSYITHATPASFISHQANRHDYEDIAADFLKTDIEVFIGGGLKHFNQRKDNLDMTEQLKENGYDVIMNRDSIPISNSDKIAGLIYKGHPPKYTKGRDEMLQICSLKAIETLNRNNNGFFLMIEASQIDWGGHDNDTEYIVDELLDFDRVVGKVLNFAEKNGNTLVIITADHETGGMGLNGGDIEKGKINAKYTTSDHSGVMVPVFAFGPGSDNFRGIYENTELFIKMMNAFGFSED